jgi:hypothetical protein
LAKKTDNPQDLERWLRENKLHTHLVAGPKEDDVLLIRVDSRNLVKGCSVPEVDKKVLTRNGANEKLRYNLLLALGPNATFHMSGACDSYEQNFDRLRVTGDACQKF